MCNTEMLLWWKEGKSLKTAFKWGMWKPPATLRAGCALLLSSRSRQAVSDSCSEEHAAPVSISSWGSAAWGITQSDFPVFHPLPPSAATCFLVASFFSFFLRKVVETPPHRPGSPESYCDCHPGCTLPSLPFPGTARQPLPLGPIKSLGPDSGQGGPFGSRPMAGGRWSLAVVIFYATPAARRFNRRHREPQSLLMGFFAFECSGSVPSLLFSRRKSLQQLWEDQGRRLRGWWGEPQAGLTSPVNHPDSGLHPARGGGRADPSHGLKWGLRHLICYIRVCFIQNTHSCRFESSPRSEGLTGLWEITLFSIAGRCWAEPLRLMSSWI